jgi:ribosomal protein S18 acetylase RimI-like enzyme
VTRQAYVDDGYMPADEPYTEHLADAERRAAEAELWVAADEGQVLGCVTFCPPGSPWREISEEGEAEFRMLAVSPAARGRGVGEALVRHCLERARELDLHVMVLSTMDKMAAAHRLYERLGFTRLSERDWEPVPGVTLLAYRLEV